MIYIVHGENSAKSRALIINQQKKLGITTAKELNLEEISLQELDAHVRANSLFGDSFFIVLNVSNSKGTEDHIKILKSKSENNIVIIYSEKYIPKTSIFIKMSTDIKAKIVENTVTHNEDIFKFVDNLFYKNRTETYREYEKLLKTETDDFYLFSMILYGLRSISKGFYRAPSLERGSSFTKNKVKSQLKGFSENNIKNLYQKFYKIEKQLKTGEIESHLAVFMGIENVLNSK